MSQDQVLKTLVDLGLTRLDCQVYVYLAKRGTQKGQNLSKGLKIEKQQLYRSLKKLQSKGIVSSTLQHPAQFSAASFEKVLDIFIKTKMAEAQRIQESKNEILENWKGLSIDDPYDSTPKFNLIEGRGPSYAKVLQMIKEAENQFSIISTVRGLLRADQFGLFDTEIKNQIKPTIRFRLLTELTEQNLPSMKKLLKEIIRTKLIFDGRTPSLNMNLPQIVIKDDKEILFFIAPRTTSSVSEDDMCLWTNCKSLVQAFIIVFENLWHNSTKIKSKIQEIETGKPTPSTLIIEDSATAQKKYHEILNSAKNEITMVTSSRGINETWENKQQLEVWTREKIFVRVMAPVISENLEAAQQLSKMFNVRHVHEGYLGTTAIDGKHLFQFKHVPEIKGPSKLRSYEGIFYTNETEYVRKTEIMLEDLWKNAQPLSTITLESIAMTNIPTIPIADSPAFRATQKMLNTVATEDKYISKQIAEKTNIEKIFEPPEKSVRNGFEEVVQFYSTNSQAIIHPPSHLNLPDLLFHTYHLEKNSTYGAADIMAIFSWLSTPNGYFFVSVACVTDNPKYVQVLKKICASTPAAENVQLVRKDELQMHVHGNTLLSAWTMHIPLIEHYILPPACLVVEAYSNDKATAYTANLPSGFTFKTHGTFRDAFVTFFHPSSNYSGPGTDGAFSRDVFIEFHPPQKLAS